MIGGLGGYLVYIALLMIIPLWAQSKVKSTYKNIPKRQHHPI